MVKDLPAEWSPMIFKSASLLVLLISHPTSAAQPCCGIRLMDDDVCRVPKGKWKWPLVARGSWPGTLRDQQL